MRTGSIRKAVLLSLLLCAGCATGRLSRVDSRAYAAASAQVLDGCYDCLVKARDGYARLVGRGVAQARVGLFETQLLLAVRRKELALDPAEPLAAAGSLAEAMPATVGATRLVELITALPSDKVGTPAEDLAPHRRLSGAVREQTLLEVAAAIQSAGLTAPVSDYLRAAARCAYGGVRASEATGPAPADTPFIPLLAYRRAVCDDAIDVAMLEAVRTAVPGFAEAAIFIGRAAFAGIDSGSGGQVESALLTGYERFPDSPVVTLHLATLFQLQGDCPRAIGYFTGTLSLQERHEAARLGRAICRSYAGDPQGAISDATQLIDRKTNLGDALYWRAWNLRNLERLAEARADTDRAKTVSYNTRILTLAGMIEHEQGDDMLSAADLVEAKQLDDHNCVARWYLGRVKSRLEGSLAAAGEFVEAADCYDALAAKAEAARQEVARRTDLPEAFRMQQEARFSNELAENRSGASASALSAAQSYAEARDRRNASRLAERAAVDPARRLDVERLNLGERSTKKVHTQ